MGSTGLKMAAAGIFASHRNGQEMHSDAVCICTSVNGLPPVILGHEGPAQGVHKAIDRNNASF